MRGLLAVLLLLPLAAAHPSAPDHGGPGLSAYDPAMQELVHRLPDVDASLAAWEAAHPDLVDRMTIGATGVLGLPLYAVRITNESVPFDAANTSTGQKVRVYLDGGHHGNEFLGVDLIMYYLEQVLDEADGALADYLRTHEIYATPIVNPEGNTLDTRKNANQVDVNRNYGYEFGGPGSGSMVFELNYRGSHAFSEPEVEANADFARSIMPDVWITTHTGVAEFYWPWGWTYDKSPDFEFFESIEKPFEDATKGRVDAMMAAELYLAAGATDDWGYGQLGIPTHTFEVHEDQFVPVYGQGVPAVIQEQLAGLDFVVKNARVWGAWLDLHDREGQLHIWNEGWGKAVNVTLEYGGATIVIPEILPGDMYMTDIVGGDAIVSYRQMVIDAPEAKTRVVQYTPHGEPASEPADDADTPAPAALLVAAALVAMAFVLRRRSV